MEPLRAPQSSAQPNLDSMRGGLEPIRAPEHMGAESKIVTAESTPDLMNEKKFTDVYFSSDFLRDMLGAETDEPARVMLLDLVTLAKKRQATDIHIQMNNSCRLRVHGKIGPAFNETGDGSIYSTNEDMFNALRETIGFTDIHKTGSKVYRFATEQIRVQYFPKATAPQMSIRIQPLTPPKSAVLLDPDTSLFLRNATGLVLVTGPIGSGKTTLASSISQSWGTDGKHIYTVEDPVEYMLQPRRGMVTQVNCSMLGNTQDGVSFSEAILNALRSDIDALFIGEIRVAEVLELCLSFAVAREPVVTTFHAGGLTDGLVRAQAMAARVMGDRPANLCLIQGLHSIIYTDLAFTAEHVPVPVTVVLPTGRPEVRKIIRDMDKNGDTLNQDIEELLKDGRPDAGYVSRDLARKRALEAGATPESVEEALPPEPVILG